MTADPRHVARARWFLDRLDDAPTRIHERGVWSDRESGEGSALGSPALSRHFAAYVEGGARASVVERYRARCPHPTLDTAAILAGVVCPDCALHDEAGRIVGSTGERDVVRHRYRWPMRAALDRVSRVRVRPGRPDLRAALLALAASGGDDDRARLALAPRYPAVGDPEACRSHLDFALHALRRAYSEDVPARIAPRSEAQLDAEAAGAAAHDPGTTTEATP